MTGHEARRSRVARHVVGMPVKHVTRDDLLSCFAESYRQEKWLGGFTAYVQNNLSRLHMLFVHVRVQVQVKTWTRQKHLNLLD